MLGRLYQLIIISLLLAAAAILIFGAATDHRLAYASRDWPERMATVTQEALARESRVTVRYRLDGQTRHMRVPLSYALGFPYHSESARRTLTSRYAVGRRMAIYYDPLLPDRRAVLQPGFQPLSLALMAIGAGALLVALVLLVRPPRFLVPASRRQARRGG